MSDPKVDIVDQDPSVAAVPTGEVVNENGHEESVHEVQEAVEKATEVNLEDTASDAIEKTAANDDGKADAGQPAANGHSKHESNNYGNKSKFERNRKLDHKQRGRGSKFDPSVVPISDDATKIRNQVEFYFGDSNLPTDKHLWDLTDGAENKPVLISEIHKFGRMTRFQPYSAVVEALRESKTLDVSGPEGEESIARKLAYNPNQPKNAALARSVYVKGFGEEVPSSQFDIEAFFAPYGPTNAVRLRRSDDKSFKGSVFVEFADEETAKKFLDLESKPLFKGVDLQIMSKKEYEDVRIQEIKEGKREPNRTRGPRGSGYRSYRGDREHGDRDRGDRDPDDWKKRREDDQKSGFRDNKRSRQGFRGGRNGRGRDGGRRSREDNRNQEREEAEEPTKKRAREDDEEGTGDISSKKVDVKEGASAEAAS